MVVRTIPTPCRSPDVVVVEEAAEDKVLNPGCCDFSVVVTVADVVTLAIFVVVVLR